VILKISVACSRAFQMGASPPFHKNLTKPIEITKQTLKLIENI